MFVNSVHMLVKTQRKYKNMFVMFVQFIHNKCVAVVHICSLMFDTRPIPCEIIKQTK